MTAAATFTASCPLDSEADVYRQWCLARGWRWPDPVGVVREGSTIAVTIGGTVESYRIVCPTGAAPYIEYVGADYAALATAAPATTRRGKYRNNQQLRLEGV